MIPACRMSGEMNTSLGNGFTNLMVFLFLMKHYGARNYDCVIEGDDCLGRLYSPRGKEHLTGEQIRIELTALYNDFGMNVKIEIHEDLCMASFCGLVFDEHVMVNIVDPLKVMLNIGWTASKYLHSSVKMRNELLRGKALSILAANAGCPIVQSVACWLDRKTANGKYRIDDYWLKAQVERILSSIKPIPVDERSRVVMEKKFGWSREEQVELEKFFDNLDALTPWYHPIVFDHCNADQIHYYNHYIFHNYQGSWPSLALPDQKTTPK